jgi:hypothetical protein
MHLCDRFCNVVPENTGAKASGRFVRIRSTPFIAHSLTQSVEIRLPKYATRIYKMKPFATYPERTFEVFVVVALESKEINAQTRRNRARIVTIRLNVSPQANHQLASTAEGGAALQ